MVLGGKKKEGTQWIYLIWCINNSNSNRKK
jgi:hypothetical protein